MADAKPVACGACGGDRPHDIVDYVHGEPVDISIECKCGVRGPRIPIGSTIVAAYPLAVAAWNRMWAPRVAGEATRRLMEAIGNAAKLNRPPEAPGHVAIVPYWGGWRSEGSPRIDAAVIAAAQEELGLSAPT